MNSKLTSQTSQGDTGTGTWGLVHLTVHKGDLGTTLGGIEVDDTGGDHLVVEIVTLTSALTDTGEHGETTVRHGNVVDELHNKHSLADTGTTEETNLTTLAVWGKEIDDLDTGLENLLGDVHLNELWSFAVNWKLLGSSDWTTLVDWLTNDVDNAALNTLAGEKKEQKRNTDEMVCLDQR